MADHAYMRPSHMTWLLMNLTGGFPKVYQQYETISASSQEPSHARLCALMAVLRYRTSLQANVRKK